MVKYICSVPVYPILVICTLYILKYINPTIPLKKLYKCCIFLWFNPYGLFVQQQVRQSLGQLDGHTVGKWLITYVYLHWTYVVDQYVICEGICVYTYTIYIYWYIQYVVPYVYIYNIWKLHRHHHGSNHRQNMKQSSVHVADSCQPKIGFNRNILIGIRFDNNDDEDKENNEE